MGFTKENTLLDLWQCLMQKESYIDFKYCVVEKEMSRRKLKPIVIKLQKPPKIRMVGDLDTSIDPAFLK